MFHCKTCLTKGLAKDRDCSRFGKDYILFMGDEGAASDEEAAPFVVSSSNKKPMAKIKKRRVRKYRTRSAEMVAATHGEDKVPEHLKLNKKKDEEGRIIFDKDGFKHRRCPVEDCTQEIQGIIDDTLYCIETGSLPNEGNGMDQSAIYKVAFMALLNERRIIKNEREVKAMEESKKKNKPGSKGAGRKRRLGRRQG